MASGGKLIVTRANNKGARRGRKKTRRDWAFSRSSLPAFVIRSLEPNLVPRVFRLFGQRGNAETLGTSNFITAGFLR